jgi:hypothetical protein
MRSASDREPNYSETRVFDGTFFGDEREPASGDAPAVAWPWGLIVLVLAVAGLTILAGVLFPDVMGYPGDRF